MPLQAGTRRGPHEIASALGAGGMGEVYRAKDTRLDRTVAIKIVSSTLEDRLELRQRFEREARAVSSLSHPHICTLFDVGEATLPGAESPAAGPVAFLVMEYLEGETLAGRLAKGPLPLDEVLRFAIEIASALAAAQRQGITHRDLKPGNIMVTKAGTKLLDFGLAKWETRGAIATGASTLPTREAPLTAEGTLVGTFHYMAPEQLEGKDADTRSDLFAFGAVVYEMVTGRKAFEGATPARAVAASGVLVLAGGIYLRTRRQAMPGSMDAVQVVQLTTSGNAERPAISPDGKYVVYVQHDGNDYSLWIRQTTTASNVQIVPPESGVELFGATVTPNGSFVDFIRRQQGQAAELWRVPFLGGTPQPLIDNAWTPEIRRAHV